MLIATITLIMLTACGDPNVQRPTIKAMEKEPTVEAASESNVVIEEPDVISDEEPEEPTMESGDTTAVSEDIVIADMKVTPAESFDDVLATMPRKFRATGDGNWGKVILERDLDAEKFHNHIIPESGYVCDKKGETESFNDGKTIYEVDVKTGTVSKWDNYDSATIKNFYIYDPVIPKELVLSDFYNADDIGLKTESRAFDDKTYIVHSFWFMNDYEYYVDPTTNKTEYVVIKRHEYDNAADLPIIMENPVTLKIEAIDNVTEPTVDLSTAYATKLDCNVGTDVREIIEGTRYGNPQKVIDPEYYKKQGYEVFVNGKKIEEDTLLNGGDEVSIEGEGSHITYVVGLDMYDLTNSEDEDTEVLMYGDQ